MGPCVLAVNRCQSLCVCVCACVCVCVCECVCVCKWNQYKWQCGEQIVAFPFAFLINLHHWKPVCVCVRVYVCVCVSGPFKHTVFVLLSLGGTYEYGSGSSCPLQINNLIIIKVSLIHSKGIFTTDPQCILSSKRPH